MNGDSPKRENPLAEDSMTGWTKCKERLPPYGKQVLLYSGSVYTGYRHHTDQSGEWWQLDIRHDKQWQGITHWMPLPEKPDEY